MLVDEEDGEPLYLVSKKEDFDDSDCDNYLSALKERRWVNLDEMLEQVNEVKIIYFMMFIRTKALLMLSYNNIGQQTW